CQGWLPATVPGSVLVSYWNAGALPDPNYGDNQLQISDSFFCADFWYRDEFPIPAQGPGRRLWIGFDGINWKADVYFNGAHLGRVDGAFTRASFDITALARVGGTNALAVLVHRPDIPGTVREKTADETGTNGGALGEDNPTFHATAGWDWIPSIRGRDIGIWSGVHVTTTGPVVIEHPLVSASLPLPATDSADVSVEVSLRNTDPGPVAGVLRGRFGRGLRAKGRRARRRVHGREVRPGLRGRPSPAQPQALVAGGIRRAEPLRRAPGVRRGRRRAVRLEAVPRGSEAVHVLGGERRAQDLHQRPPVRRARRQLGLLRVQPPLPRPRVRRRGALPPRHGLHHDPQLGRPGRRRRLLRRLRPLRRRGLAGLLAGQPA